MGHSAAGVHAEELVRNGTSRSVTAADIGCSCTQNGCVRTLSPAGTELQNRPPLSGTDNTVCLSGNQTLMVDAQQQECFDELSLNGRGANSDDGLLGEHRSALRNGPDIAGKLKIRQIIQEFLAKQIAATQIFNILRIKPQLLNVLDDLLQTSRNGKAAAIGTTAVEKVKIRDAVLVALFKIAMCHGQLIEVAEHGQIDLIINLHRENLSFDILLSL